MRLRLDRGVLLLVGPSPMRESYGVTTHFISIRVMDEYGMENGNYCKGYEWESLKISKIW